MFHFKIITGAKKNLQEYKLNSSQTLNLNLNLLLFLRSRIRLQPPSLFFWGGGVYLYVHLLVLMLTLLFCQHNRQLPPAYSVRLVNAEFVSTKCSTLKFFPLPRPFREIYRSASLIDDKTAGYTRPS